MYTNKDYCLRSNTVHYLVKVADASDLDSLHNKLVTDAMFQLF